MRCPGLAFTFLLACAAAQAAPDACLRTAAEAPPPTAQAMAAAAEREHAAWGGQAFDAQGRLVAGGAAEAEDGSPLRRPAPWQRVLGYWRAVDAEGQRQPAQIRFGALRPADRRLLGQALDQAAETRLQGLGVGPDQGLASHELRAARTALDRVAVIDTPWSAAFVSWLAREAGLDADAFAFSEAHADYAAAAWTAGMQEAAGQPTRYALRACDLARTPPRAGDLVCHARGSRGALDGFGALAEALRERATAGRALPMHCDVVVRVDEAGFDAVGGNVLNSVTLRRLAFAPGTRLLDPSYRPGCADCTDRHMSSQPWSLLLQWR